MIRNIKVSAFQIGARNNYLLPSALQKNEVLNRFYTDIWLNQKQVDYLSKLESKLARALAGRSQTEIPENLIVSFPLLGITFSLLKRFVLKATPNIRMSLNIRMAEIFGKKVAKLIRNDGSNIVYGFSFEAAEVFEQNADKFKIADQYGCPLFYYEILKQETEKWPQWEKPIDIPILKKVVEREKTSCELADIIFVPSEFVRNYLLSQMVSPQKIIVCPYGQINKVVEKPKQYSRMRKLRILYVGAINLMKGIPYLLEALDLLNIRDIEIYLVGPVFIKENIIKKWRERYNFVGPIPHKEVHKYYEWADIFVFPSLCEGSAIVTYEALFHGLPIITTPNSGSVIRDGVEGFIVPIRDPEALANKILKFLEEPCLVYEMSYRAIQLAKDYTLERYGEKLVDAIINGYSSRKEIGSLKKSCSASDGIGVCSV